VLLRPLRLLLRGGGAPCVYVCVCRQIREDDNHQPTQTTHLHNQPTNRDLVKSIAQDGYLVVTWANHHYTDFALTWVHHVQQAGIKGYMVGAMDEEILLALAKRSIHTFSMSSGAGRTHVWQFL
jgi:hypothetical protein